MSEQFYTEGEPIRDTKAPGGPDRGALGQAQVRASSWSTRPTSASTTSSSSAPAWPAASAAATLAELGYNVEVASASRTARAARTRIAAQGGINAAKNYQNDGDSVYRLFYDTVKGGDFRAREANVYRLAEVSRQHHRPVRRAGRAVRPRVRRPARQPLASAARRSRAPSTPAARPASSCCSAPTRRSSGRSAPARSRCHPRTEMLDLVVVDGQARGIVVRDLVTGEIERARGRRGRAGDRRLRQRVLPVDQRQGLQRHRDLARATSAAPCFANPCYTQIHPTCIPVSGDYQSKLTLMSESLRNDGRVWVPKSRRRRPRPAATIPEDERDYYLERKYPSFGNLVAARHRLARRQGGLRRGPRRRPRRPAASTSTSPTRSSALGADDDRRASTATCSTCTSASPARTPTRCRCASTRPSTTRWAACGWTTT